MLVLRQVVIVFSHVEEIVLSLFQLLLHSLSVSVAVVRNRVVVIIILLRLLILRLELHSLWRHLLLAPSPVLADRRRRRLRNCFALQLVLFFELVLVVLVKGLVPGSHVYDSFVVLYGVAEYVPWDCLFKVFGLRLESILPFLLLVHVENVFDACLGL